VEAKAGGPAFDFDFAGATPLRRLQRWVLLRISAASHSNHSKGYLQK